MQMMNAACSNTAVTYSNVTDVAGNAATQVTRLGARKRRVRPIAVAWRRDVADFAFDGHRPG